VDVELCETEDADALEAAVARGCDLLYLETPTNPTLRVLDLRRLIAAGHRAGAVVVVDNTFASPVNQRPLELGADLVLHSATKFLGGHSDAMGGIVCGRRDLVRQIFRFREINGATLAAPVAHLLVRSLKTLELRVLRQNENAMGLARFLHDHPAVERVFYPGLPDDPGHGIAASQMSGFGGVLSFSLPGDDLAPVKRFVEKLRFAHRAASLEPGIGGDTGGAARGHQPRRADAGGSGQAGNPGDADPLRGGDREPGRPDRGLPAGAGVGGRRGRHEWCRR
jgi:cystathionine gamma-synthase